MPSNMHISPAGRQELSFLEGKRLTAYPDPASHGEPWTIGVGHTFAAGPPRPVPGMRISQTECDAILAADLLHIYEPILARRVKIELAQYEFDALGLFVFNLGETNFAGSTLLSCLNRGDRVGAARQFLVWDKAQGRVNVGLQTRRRIESQLFLTGEYATSLTPAHMVVNSSPAVALRYGNVGDNVHRMQLELASLHFYIGQADGQFGPTTLNAVKAFQRDAGLSDDGIAGLKTLAALDTAMQRNPIAV